MKYFIIADKNGKFKGYTKSRKILNTFFEQHTKKNYIVQVFNKKHMNQKLIDELENSCGEIVLLDGVIFVLDEQTRFSEGVYYFFIESKACIDKIYNMCKYISLTESEYKIIMESLAILYTTLNKARGSDEEIDNWDVDVEYDDYLEMNKMMKDILSNKCIKEDHFGMFYNI